MNQKTITISWKSPTNRGAVITVLGVSLLIQTLAVAYAILVFKLGTNEGELIFLAVISIVLSIILTVFVLTGFEYLNERKSQLEYRNISGISIIVLIVFMITYAWGLELIKTFVTELAAMRADLTFLLSELIGTSCVFVFFYMFHAWNTFKASVKL
ncbi:MAG: hypothetical protein ACXAEU_13910 [Candidatus Hodarchaeales archaeon]